MCEHIPRIIHQTWKNQEVPKVWSRSPVLWKSLHPEWDYRLWTDEDLRQVVAEVIPQYLCKYDALRYEIQRVDVARTVVLYQYGGLYSDLDIVPRRSFEPFTCFFESEAFTTVLSGTPNGYADYHHSNYLMMSKPRSLFWPRYWKFVFEEEWKTSFPWYMRPLMLQLHFYVMFTTGPTAISRTFQLWSMAQPGGYNRDVLTLPYQYVNPVKSYMRKTLLDAQVMCTHLPGESWCNKTTGISKVYAELYDKRGIFVTVFTGMLVLILSVVLLILHFTPVKKNC